MCNGMMLRLCRLLRDSPGLKSRWGNGRDFSAGSCPPIQLSYQLPLALSWQPLGEAQPGCAWVKKENPERDSEVMLSSPISLTHSTHPLTLCKSQEANKATDYLFLDLKWNCNITLPKGVWTLTHR